MLPFILKEVASHLVLGALGAVAGSMFNGDDDGDEYVAAFGSVAE